MATFKDDKGREWSLAVTIDSVKAYEKQTGKKVFALLFELYMQFREKTGKPMEIILSVAAAVFPGIDEAAAFVYGSGTVIDGKKPTYEEFCATSSPIAIGKAAIELAEQLQQFMPEPDTMLKKEEGLAAPLGQ